MGTAVEVLMFTDSNILKTILSVQCFRRAYGTQSVSWCVPASELAGYFRDSSPCHQAWLA
jgi:hypothetical protein